MERSTNVRKKTTVRKELELFVVAWNTCLKGVVKHMDNIILLRNAHPIYRADFAYRLRDEGSITVEQSKEFVRL
jgi:hypothetical protein